MANLDIELTRSEVRIGGLRSTVETFQICPVEDVPLPS